MSIDNNKRFLLRGMGSDDRKQPNRLPWVNENLVFTDLCTRCDKCIKACPTKIIKRGDGGFPEIDFTIDECLLCKDCVNICDIDLFDLDKEAPWKIKATIDQGCLNSKNVYCRSCSDACEIEAISFVFTSTIFTSPTINNDACTGCGACVSSCPSDAIKMQTPETRKDN